MELVFRGNKTKGDDFYDLYVVLDKDGSVKLTIRSKNETGQSSFHLSSTEIDKLYAIREMVKEETTNS